MKKLLLLTLTTLALNAENIEIKGLASPESVLAENGQIFVSNIGTKPDAANKDNDGFISLIEDGKNVALFNKLNAPKGMAKLENTLFVVDINRLVAFDLSEQKQLFELAIKNAAFLNDIVALDEKTLFISDTGNGKIYKFDTQSKEHELFATLDMPLQGGANGLVLSPEKDALIVAGYHPDGKSGGMVLKIDLKSKEISQIISEKSNFDGVAYDSKGVLYVSDWGSDLKGVVYKIINGEKVALNLPSMKGPADIYIENDLLYIPIMLENRLLIVDLNDIKDK